MSKNKLVRITEENFQEAGGKEIFGKLKMLGLVCASIDGPGPVPLNVDVYYENIQKVNNKLTEEAKKIGAKYVFGVKYEGLDGGQENVNVRGTAYKIRGPIRKFLASWG